MGASARYQPQGVARINRGHPFGPFITGAWQFNRPDFRNIADPSSKAATVAGAPALTAYPGGLCVTGVNGRIDTGCTASKLGINGARKRTILLDYQHKASNTNGTILQFGGTSVHGGEFALRVNGDFQLIFGGFFADGTFTTSPGNGIDHRIQVAIMYDGATLSIYAIATGSDGVHRYTGSSAMTLATTDEHTLSFLSGTFDYYNQFPDQLYSAVVLSDRVATPAEIEKYFANTNAIYDAGSSSSAYQATIASTGGAAGLQLTPGVAALVLAGYAPTIAQTASASASPGAGALVLTGYAPSLAQTASQSIQPAAGALALSGLVPQVTQTADQAVSPNGAGLALAGLAPSVAQTSGTTALPQPGALTLTGPAPSITQTANIAVALAPAALAITGYAPQVTQIGSIALSPASGALNIAGYAPTITQGGTGAPSYGSSKSKRKYVVRKGDQLHVFTDPRVAQQFLHAGDELEPAKQYPAKKQGKRMLEPVKLAPQPEPIPEQRVDLAEIRALAARMHAEAEYQQLMAQRHYEAMLALLERLRDEEEDDWLLMAAE